MVQLSSFLVTGADGRWHPGIGDPGVVGWLTVAAYFAAGALAYRALRLHRAGAADARSATGSAQGDLPARAGGSSRPAIDEAILVRFWGLVLFSMLLLGVNKQLDLQTWFTEIGRDLAHRQGWYEVRRPLQVAFIALIGVAGAAATVGLAFSIRHVLHRVIGALVGLGALVTFVIVRAASFHHVDMLLGRGRVRLNWVLELGGIALIAISAFRQKSHQSGRPSD
jgi:hypothetical protein